MKILVEGDSWCFSWDVQGVGLHFNKPLKSDAFKDFVEGDPYLQKLLCEAGHDVTTTGQGGSSNALVIDRLWANDSSTEYDLVIIFQTSPLRDLDTNNTLKCRDPVYMKNIIDTISDKSVDEYNDIVQGFAYGYYEKLYQVAEAKYPNANFLLMGGNSKIDPVTWKRFQSDYPNSKMHVLHYSILEMLISHFDYDFGWFKSAEPILDLKHHTENGFNNWNLHVDESWNHDLIEYLHQSEVNRNQAMLKTYFFTYPDAGHLNRQSFLYVADDILCWMQENLET